MVVALELRRCAALGNTVIELHDEVDVYLGVHLDDRVGPHRLELLDLSPDPGPVSAQEVVRRPAARQPQIRGTQHGTRLGTAAQGRRDDRAVGPTERTGSIQGTLEREHPARDVYVVTSRS